MKKLLISIFLFFVITSCWKNELWMNIEKNNENNTISWSVQTWSILEETNTWSIQESSNKKELIKEENWNIYLYENWIKIETLTTRATKCIDEYCNGSINYEIIQSKWNYWIVYKREQFWECGTTTFYWYDFSTNEELLTKIDELWFCFLDFIWKINWNNLDIYIETPEYVVNVPESKWEISKIDAIVAWFIEKWNDWVKTFDLKDIIKPEIKKEEKIETPKVDNKYSNDNLIKNWYKLNNIWNIKEYSKISKRDNNQWNWWLVYMYNTIYIQWDKILEIIGSDSDTTSWFMASITIYDWKNTKIINEDEIWKFEYWFPIQAIFNENGPKILIYEWLNKVNIVDKSQWLSKTIWER